jgi:TrkA-C domain.
LAVSKSRPEANGKGKVKDLDLPGNMLIALVVRGKERITARGDTVLLSGDRVILVTKTFEDTQTFLMEKTVKPGGKRDGHAIREFDSEGLVLLVLRGDKKSFRAATRFWRPETCW